MNLFEYIYIELFDQGYKNQSTLIITYLPPVPELPLYPALYPPLPPLPLQYFTRVNANIEKPMTAKIYPKFLNS